LADDSGLEVEALEWRPGVQSARYAGDHPTYQDNIQKLLKELRDVPREKRRAVFRCCMVLFHPDGRERVSHGELWGVIRETPAGSHGFGYDPVFEIPEAGRTLAQMSLREKNKISHRVRALDKMKQHLQEILVP
jgi:XTP/dITP diphosphohydrolase